MRKDLVRCGVEKRLGAPAALSFVLLLLVLPAAAEAENITFPSESSGNIMDGYSSFGKIYVPGGNNPIASGNTVTVNGEVTDGHIVGGGSINGNATGNTVIIRNSATVGANDNQKMVIGGFAADGSAVGNTVTMNGGTVYGHIMGGASLDGGDVENNTATISGGTVTGDIYGGSGINGKAVYNTA
jgi:hypothetical protein